jgi:predicted HTH domain antitoxin
MITSVERNKACLPKSILFFRHYRQRRCINQPNTIKQLLAQKRRIVIVARKLAMSVVPAEILTATRMTEAEICQEIAVMLFQKEKLTLAQASRFAGMHRIAFQHLLASRHIPVHYGVEDFEQDIKNLKEMGRL